MSQTDSFIDEVTEEVRRERLSRWLRRYGWMVALGLLLVVGLAAWIEWRQARARALAELRGEVLLSALEIEDGPGRLAALSEAPTGGDEGVVAALLLAAEQQAEGEAAAAVATLDALAADGDVAPLYRDLAALKSLMIQGAEADRAALEALAAPGAPFRLVALEQLALTDLAAGRREEALAGIEAILEDADVTGGQRARLEALRTALGAPAPVSAPAAPSGEGAAPAPAGE